MLLQRADGPTQELLDLLPDELSADLLELLQRVADGHVPPGGGGGARLQARICDSLRLLQCDPADGAELPNPTGGVGLPEASAPGAAGPAGVAAGWEEGGASAGSSPMDLNSQPLSNGGGSGAGSMRRGSSGADGTPAGERRRRTP